MRHALFLPPFGELAPPSVLVGLATEAETRGWDGVFLWDHVLRPPGDPQEIADPWIALAAIAAATSRIRLGTMVTPLSRRRPQKVARETVSLDHLSNGRLVLGVGLGVDTGGELERFAEVVDERVRAERLDEALGLLRALWSGEEVHHRGPHFAASGVRFLPRPVQRPRIPVWVAAEGSMRRMGPLRRAARSEGLFPVHATADDVAWMVGRVAELRGSTDAFDVAAELAPDASGDDLDAMARAGATWAMWSFGVHATAEAVTRTVTAGPPGG